MIKTLQKSLKFDRKVYYVVDSSLYSEAPLSIIS